MYLNHIFVCVLVKMILPAEARMCCNSLITGKVMMNTSLERREYGIGSRNYCGQVITTQRCLMYRSFKQLRFFQVFKTCLKNSKFGQFKSFSNKFLPRRIEYFTKLKQTIVLVYLGNDCQCENYSS